MNRISFIFTFFVLIVSCTNSDSKDYVSQSSSDNKTVAELMQEQAEENKRILEESKRNLDDLSKMEIEEMLVNPKNEDKDLLIALFDRVDKDTFYFEALNEMESFIYKTQYYDFFKYPNSVESDEIIVYTPAVDGIKEIKRFYNFIHVLEEPENTPGHFYFYIENKDSINGNYLWHLDGNLGIGELLLEVASFDTISTNGEYFAEVRNKNEKGIYYGDENITIPNVLIYSVQEKKFIREISFYDLYKDEAENAWYSLEISSKDESFIVKVMLDHINVATYAISLPSCHINRIE